MSLASLGGSPATRARVQVPSWGLWWADVELAEPAELDGVQTLTIGDVTATGKVYGGAFEGRASYRVVGGVGGWGTAVDARSYSNDLGILAADVISDAAREVGETVEGAPDTVLGPHFARHEGLASDVLNMLAPRAWYVDFEGVTRFGSRETTTYAGDAPRTRVDPAAGVIEIATEEIAALVPGVTIDGSEPAADVEYVLDETRLTVKVWADRASQGDRLTAAIASIVEALDPRRRYRGVYEFRVVSQILTRLNLQPVRSANGFSDLRLVPVRPGVGGMMISPLTPIVPGTLVLVAFVDADPARPVVVAFDDPLFAPGAIMAPVALVGDAVSGAVITGPGSPYVVARKL